MRTAFTLIELMAVIVLMALLSATATLMVRAPLAKAKQDQAIAQIRFLDATARDRARQGEQVRLEFDLQASVATLIDGQGEEIVNRVALSDKPYQVMIMGAEKTDDSHRWVCYDQFGKSRSFAAQIGDQSSTNGWLMVLGMTGQTYMLNEKGAVHAIISRERNHPR